MNDPEPFQLNDRVEVLPGALPKRIVGEKGVVVMAYTILSNCTTYYSVALGEYKDFGHGENKYTVRETVLKKIE